MSETFSIRENFREGGPFRCFLKFLVSAKYAKREYHDVLSSFLTPETPKGPPHENFLGDKAFLTP